MSKPTLQERLHDAGEAGLFTAYEVATLLNALSDPRKAAKKLFRRPAETYLSHELALGVQGGVFLATDKFTLCNAARNRWEASPLYFLGYVSSWEITRHATLAHLLGPAVD